MIKLEKILREGGVGVMATDTLYGLVGCALNREVVDRIYKLKKRRPNKPFIILISNYDQLSHFGIIPTESLKIKLDKYWPGPVSIILPCNQHKFEYLHRGSESLAFRMPAKKKLLNLLKATGPLVAPSANPEGEPPANTIKQAKKYFGKTINLYSIGKTSKTASKIIKIVEEKVIVIRA